MGRHEAFDSQCTVCGASLRTRQDWRYAVGSAVGSRNGGTAGGGL